MKRRCGFCVLLLCAATITSSMGREECTYPPLWLPYVVGVPYIEQCAAHCDLLVVAEPVSIKDAEYMECRILEILKDRTKAPPQKRGNMIEVSWGAYAFPVPLGYYVDDDGRKYVATILGGEHKLLTRSWPKLLVGAEYVMSLWRDAAKPRDLKRKFSFVPPGVKMRRIGQHYYPSEMFDDSAFFSDVWPHPIRFREPAKHIANGRVREAIDTVLPLLEKHAAQPYRTYETYPLLRLVRRWTGWYEPLNFRDDPGVRRKYLHDFRAWWTANRTRPPMEWMIESLGREDFESWHGDWLPLPYVATYDERILVFLRRLADRYSGEPDEVKARVWSGLIRMGIYIDGPRNPDELGRALRRGDEVDIDWGQIYTSWSVGIAIGATATERIDIRGMGEMGTGGKWGQRPICCGVAEGCWGARLLWGLGRGMVVVTGGRSEEEIVGGFRKEKYG